jgi:hypothetical protein
MVIDSREGLKLEVGVARGCNRDEDETGELDVVVVVGIRGMGSYSPSFSMGRASRRLRPLMATCSGKAEVEMERRFSQMGISYRERSVACN